MSNGERRSRGLHTETVNQSILLDHVAACPGTFPAPLRTVPTKERNVHAQQVAVFEWTGGSTLIGAGGIEVLLRNEAPEHVARTGRAAGEQLSRTLRSAHLPKVF